MIRVVRIAGESFDLETGAELSKALVLSNGLRELSVPVDDSIAITVVKMMAESQEARNQSVVRKAQTVPVPGNGSSRQPEPQIHRQTFGPEEVEGPVPQPVMASVVDAPEDEEFDESVYEPGEEYNDPSTGVGSL